MATVSKAMVQGCDAAYAIFPKPTFVIPWATLFELLASLISGACKPASNRDASALVTKFGKRVSGGVKGCCPANVRKRVMATAGVDDATIQDRVFYVMVNQGNHSRKDAEAALLA